MKYGLAFTLVVIAILSALLGWQTASHEKAEAASSKEKCLYQMVKYYPTVEPGVEGFKECKNLSDADRQEVVRNFTALVLAVKTGR